MTTYSDEVERAHALAIVRFGSFEPPPRVGPSLVASVPMASLDGGPTDEVWPASGQVSRFETDDATYAADGGFLFAAGETVTPDDGPGIQAAAYDLYRRMLRGVARAGYPHVLRAWNYVPNIHEASGRIDRYMRFCSGRSKALAAHLGSGFPDQLPAASAVGCPGRSLVVHLLAAREPGRHVENPRQLAAYRYPDRYGPTSPSFARATVTPDGTVLLSGTASIVGHESVHPGDPARQAEETMRNIEAVLDAAEVAGKGGKLGPRLRSLRVYVRHPAHLEALRAAIFQYTQASVPTAWLQAQICREELLVEIEAIGRVDAGLRPMGLTRKDKGL